MLAHVCLLALIGFSISLEIEKVMPSRYEIEGSINRTIDEVEKLIRENPSLPKLSRTDIVNILYNITSKDMSSIEHETLEALQKMRTDYQRALMVVLPYKLKNSENLKDLYTKPPMVQILADEEFDPKKYSKIESTYNPSLFSGKHTQKIENVIENKHQLVATITKVENSENSKTSVKTNFKDLEMATTADILNNTKTEFEPQKFNFNLDFVDQTAEGSHTSIATKRPIYKGTFSRYRTSTQTPPKSKIIYSSTTTMKPATSTEVQKTTVRNKSTQNVLSSDQWHYYAPPTTETSRQTLLDNPMWKPMTPIKSYFIPITKNSSNDVILSTSIRSVPIFVTPSVPMIQENVHSNTKTIPTELRIMTTTIKPTAMREEVELLLKSIGLQPIEPTDQKNNFKLIKNTIDVPLNSHFEGNVKEVVKSDLLNTLQNDSFQIPSLVIEDNIKNLSPDIQLLFQQFGLHMPAQKEISTITTYKPTTPTTSINLYTHFKPLPISSVKDKDFRNFLARFGLGIGENRNDKSIQSIQTTKRPSLIEAVPDNMKKILENIGLIKKNQKIESIQKQEIETQTEASKSEEQTTLSRGHIFKPYEKTVEDKEQNIKIKNLLNTVRMVQEGRANVQDVQDIANDLLQNTKFLGTGPDPLKLEEILNNYRNNLKIEVKRQPEKIPVTTSTAASITDDVDKTTLSFMTTTDSSSSFSEYIVSSSLPEDKTKQQQTDQASLFPSKTKAKNPSFFDTFDISKYLNKTDNDTSSSSTTISSLNSDSSSKPSFFDTFNISDHINKTIDDDLAKNVNVSLSDLEASFGGSTEEPDPVIPTRPKTGLYFLVDWNTFLEVGEEGKEKVNLRFTPKVGDRTRFISVKMP